jgi:WD40 repeat protein
MCSNSETLKLLDLSTGLVELYKGHTDIILCLDICQSSQLCLTGSKDNSVLLWKYNLNEAFQ